LLQAVSVSFIPVLVSSLAKATKGRKTYHASEIIMISTTVSLPDFHQQLCVEEFVLTVGVN
jgi:hypothetical protein